jgi:hypothetical protein
VLLTKRESSASSPQFLAPTTAFRATRLGRKLIKFDEPLAFRADDMLFTMSATMLAQVIVCGNV